MSIQEEQVFDIEGTDLAALTLTQLRFIENAIQRYGNLLDDASWQIVSAREYDPAVRDVVIYLDTELTALREALGPVRRYLAKGIRP